ncbi:unnamed protein product [Prunus brigantina]
MSEIKIQHQYWQATDGCGVGLGSGSSMRGGHSLQRQLILCTCRHAEIEALIHIVMDDFKDTFAAPSQICLLKVQQMKMKMKMKMLNLTIQYYCNCNILERLRLRHCWEFPCQ